jgi:hypothetical protein
MCNKGCQPLCCIKGQTLINGQCSIPLERTEEEKREIQRRENCLGEVKNIEKFRKLSFLPKCERTNEFPLDRAKIKLGQVRGFRQEEQDWLSPVLKELVHA